jgi:hypothetical protein
MFSQMKETQGKEEPARYQMSLQEELSSSDYMLDLMEISHDVSLDISYELMVGGNDD